MHLLVTLASLLLWITGANAHFATDPSGHWEGTITAQFGTIRIALDLTKADDGKPTGTFSVPERHLNGLPLLTITVSEKGLAFEPVVIGARFYGDFAADGNSIEGMFEGMSGSVPVTLTRNGEARITPAPRNAAVSKQLEGTWNGTLHADGVKRLMLKVANQADNSAKASMISLDEGMLELPVAIAQHGSDITVTAPMVSSTYTGSLNADGTELVGTYKTADGFELPLTLKRASASDAKK